MIRGNRWSNAPKSRSGVLKTALHWKGHPEQRQRIQMILLRESGIAQPAIADAMGVSLSTVNRAHMAYDHGGIKAPPRRNTRCNCCWPGYARPRHAYGF